MRIKRRRAFTLVEIMIVVLIIGILLAIAVPNFMTARDNSRAQACVSNLEEISAAKEQYAMDARLTDNATPTSNNLVPAYIKTMPTCPASGTYAINTIATNPTCSKGGTHVIPN
jgi:prepilin-type N-terminal cleavage/methylation domain-containing protein